MPIAYLQQTLPTSTAGIDSPPEVDVGERHQMFLDTRTERRDRPVTDEHAGDVLRHPAGIGHLLADHLATRENTLQADAIAHIGERDDGGLFLHPLTHGKGIERQQAGGNDAVDDAIHLSRRIRTRGTGEGDATKHRHDQNQLLHVFPPSFLCRCMYIVDQRWSTKRSMLWVLERPTNTTIIMDEKKSNAPSTDTILFHRQPL